MRAATATSARRSRPRAALATIVGLVVVSLCGVSLFSSWLSLSKQDSSLADERSGIAYAQPLSALIASLAMQESGIAAGAPFDPGSIETAVRATAAADAAYGARLGVSDRWTELESRIGALVGRTSTPDGSELRTANGLAVDLMDHIAAAGGLSLDSDVDIHDLAEASLRQLPTVIRGAALAASSAGDGTQDASRTAALAAAAYQIAQASDDVDALMRAAMGSVADADLISQLDAFQSSIAALGPMSVDRPDRLVAVPGPAAVERLQAATLALDQRILNRIDALLVDQQARISAQRGLPSARVSAPASASSRCCGCSARAGGNWLWGQGAMTLPPSPWRSPRSPSSTHEIRSDWKSRSRSDGGVQSRRRADDDAE